jgi:hypothetical protein
MDKQIQQSMIKNVAKVLTGHSGNEALNRFAKQLVCGACKAKGFWDHSNDSLQDVYERDWVMLGTFNVLTRFSFKNEAGSYSWDFGGGVVEGKALSGFASKKGRHSNWVGDGAKKVWEEFNVTGVVLVGFDEDIEFFYLPASEFLALEKDRLVYRGGSTQLLNWAKAWDALMFQPTFSSLMGK